MRLRHRRRVGLLGLRIGEAQNPGPESWRERLLGLQQGIEKSDELFLQEQQVQQFILPTFKLEKQNIAKNLLKSLYWALTLGTSKSLASNHPVSDPLKLSKD